MIRIVLICVTSACLWLLSCSGGSPLAGGTDTETGGSTVTARVVDNVTGAPVSGATVIARKRNYLSEDTLGLSNNRYDRVNSTTDATGFFSIDSLDTGAYLIEVVAKSKSALFATPLLVKDTTVNLQTGTLSAPIAVTGIVREIGSPIAARVRVYGLEKATMSTSDGKFSLEVPVGYRGALNATVSGISIDQPIEVESANPGSMYIEIEKSSYSQDSLVIRKFLDAAGLASLDIKSATQTDSLGRIRTLTLRNRNLSTLPKEMSSLYFLWSLELDSNSFSTLPDSLASLRLLYNFSVSSNPLGQFPTVLLSMPALRMLDISSTGITTLPPTFTNLSELGVVWMRTNGMASLPNEVLSLPHLFNLSVKGNAITQLPAGLGNCTVLQELDISDNKLTALPVEIGSLTHLKVLYAYGNQIAALPAEIGTCRALETINLNQNPLSALPSQIGMLRNVNNLSVAFTELVSLPVEIINIQPTHGLNLEGNRLCTLPVDLEAWVNQFSNPGWKATQQGCP